MSTATTSALSSAYRAASMFGADDFNSHAKPLPGVNGLQTVIGYTAWTVSGLAVIGMLVAGAAMAISHHRGSSDHIGRLGSVVAGCIVIGSASSLGGSLLGFNLFTSNPEAIPGLTMVQTLISYTAYVAGGICLLGLLVTGGLMVVAHQRGVTESLGRLGSVAGGCLIVGSAATLVGALM